MARSEHVGFRYKPRQLSWKEESDEATNRQLKMEFENIAASMSGVYDALEGAGLINTPGGKSAGSGPSEDMDYRFKITQDSDPYAGTWFEKIIAGPGIKFSITDSGAKGLQVMISADIPPNNWKPIIVVHNFNTWLDADGNVLPRYRTNAAGEREDNPHSHTLIVPHSIPNTHYFFQIYRPYETETQPTTTDVHPADGLFSGKDRGRYEVRWRNVECDPYQFAVRFHQPEYGTLVLLGFSSI